MFAFLSTVTLKVCRGKLKEGWSPEVLPLLPSRVPLHFHLPTSYLWSNRLEVIWGIPAQFYSPTCQRSISWFIKGFEPTALLEKKFKANAPLTPSSNTTTHRLTVFAKLGDDHSHMRCTQTLTNEHNCKIKGEFILLTSKVCNITALLLS